MTNLRNIDTTAAKLPVDEVKEVVCDTCDQISDSIETAKHGFDPQTHMPKTIKICDSCIDMFAKAGIDFDFVED